jgi:hypothetical protein
MSMPSAASPAIELADLVWRNPEVDDQLFSVQRTRADVPVWEVGMRFDLRVRNDSPPGRLPTMGFDDAKAMWAAGQVGFHRPVPLPKPSLPNDCVDHYWCLWIDIDHLDGLRAVDRHLKPLGFVPSAAVFTGNAGYHVYFRLRSALPVDLLEPYNHELARMVDGDTTTPPSPRTHLRIPGCIHEKSGRRAELVELTGHVVEDDVLAALTTPVLKTVTASRADSERRWHQAEMRHRDWDRRLRESEQERERLSIESQDLRARVAAIESRYWWRLAARFVRLVKSLRSFRNGIR